MLAGIAPARERLFRQARTDGRRERADALDADALVETVTAAGTAIPPATGTGPAMPPRQPGRRPGTATAKVLVRVDWDTLLRGYPIEGEVCEIAGHGPIAVSAVRDMIDSGDPFLAAVATRGRQITGVAHLGRKATAHQRTALQWRDPACAADGCPRHTRLQEDHREPRADTKITLVDLMDRLCEHHHALKTHSGWALLPGHGKRPFVPPDDHRHPARTPAKAAGP